MFEQSISVMWDVMSGWCTPTVLFVLLNFMIATIFVTSGFGSHQQPQLLNKPDLQQQPQLLNRAPSVLQRLKSINFYQYASYYRSQEPAAPLQASYGYDETMQAGQMEEEAAAYPLTEEETERHEYGEERGGDEDELESYEAEDRFEQVNGDKSLDEVYNQLQQGSHFNRTKSDTEPASGAVPVKLVKNMKKSASSKSAFRHFTESEVLEARRPATVREAKARSAAAAEDDEEVDSKADDFINKFKQQLKLQRLDSILRYKEMLGRGADK
uniref:DUF4408 domain-containing protein n=1 Tax=Kalanchoe fedtschenkoi TaxID=63787 RepID=A0A7N0V572_KALFE